MRRRSSASMKSGHFVPACFENSAKPGTGPSGDVRASRSESRYTERYAALSRLLIAAMFLSKTARASSTSEEDEDFLEGEEGEDWARADAAIGGARANTVVTRSATRIAFCQMTVPSKFFFGLLIFCWPHGFTDVRGRATAAFVNPSPRFARPGIVIGRWPSIADSPNS